MQKVLLSPHNDDAELFACFTLLREKPHVVVCMRCDYNADPMYGAPHDVRERETMRSLNLLGVTWEQWDISETRPDWAEMERRICGLRKRGYTRAWVPMVELSGGHPHHDRIGAMSLAVWPDAARYCTYSLAGKSIGIEVPYHPRWVAAKLRALACYQSQAGGVNAHKYFIRDQREYVASEQSL